MLFLGAQKGYPPWARSPPQIKRRTPQLVNPTQPRRVLSTILFSCASAFVFVQQLHQHCIAWCFPIHLPGMCLVHLLNFKTPKPKKHHLPNDRFLIKILLKNDDLGAQKGYPPWARSPPQIKKTPPPISKPHLASKMAFLFLRMTCHISLASCLLIHLPSLCLCIWLMASMLMLLVLGHCLLLFAFSCKSSSSQSKKKGLCSCNASWDWGCKAWWSGGRFGSFASCSCIAHACVHAPLHADIRKCASLLGCSCHRSQSPIQKNHQMAPFSHAHDRGTRYKWQLLSHSSPLPAWCVPYACALRVLPCPYGMLLWLMLPACSSCTSSGLLGLSPAWPKPHFWTWCLCGHGGHQAWASSLSWLFIIILIFIIMLILMTLLICDAHLVILLMFMLELGQLKPCHKSLQLINY